MDKQPEIPPSDESPAIDSLLESMIKEKKLEPFADETTALSNLKNVLSKADETAALNSPNKILKEEIPSEPPVIQVPEKSKAVSKTSPVFASGPVCELDALIKAYRAQVI